MPRNPTWLKGISHARKPKTDVILTSEQEKDIAKVKRVMPSVLRVFIKAFSMKGGRNAAIRAKCIECSNFQKAEVGACSISGCPLWRYRPYQDKRKPAINAQSNTAL